MYIAELLTNLIRLPNVVISSRDHWMSQGLRDYKETTLVDSSYFLPPDKCKALTEWWGNKWKALSNIVCRNLLQVRGFYLANLASREMSPCQV